MLLKHTLLAFVLCGMAAPDAFDDAVQGLKDALAVDDTAATKKSIDALAELGDPRGLTVLNDHLADVVARLAKADADVGKLENERERRARAVDRKKTLANDEAKRAEVEKEEAALKEWQQKTLEPAKKSQAALAAAREGLMEGSGKLVEKLTPDRRRAEVDRLRKIVVSEGGWQSRAAAMESYARLGDKDAVATLLKVGKDALAQRKRAQAELPDKESTYEKALVILAREVQQMGGRFMVATKNQVDRALKEVTAIRERLEGERVVAESAFRLLASAIAALPEDARAKAATEAINAAKSTDPALRLTAIGGLGGLNDPAVLAYLRSVAAGPGDPATRIAAIDALARLRDAGSLDAILDKCLKDPEWTVRAAAIQALAGIRAPRAIPGLIAALENEVGRLRDDATDALRSLTGLHFPTPAAWKSWWEKNQTGFEPPPLAASAPAERKPAAGDTVAFAGIVTSSRN